MDFTRRYEQLGLIAGEFAPVLGLQLPLFDGLFRIDVVQPFLKCEDTFRCGVKGPGLERFAMLYVRCPAS
jgi:hypothetical protein